MGKIHEVDEAKSSEPSKNVFGQIIGEPNENDVERRVDNDIETTVNDAEEFTVICGACNEVFINIAECEKHMESHPSKCYMCDFQSEDKDELNNHELRVHLYQKCKPGSHEVPENLCQNRA